MSHRLRAGLSFCRVDDGLIFLDLDADRYFRLAARLEEAFLGYLRGEGHRTEGLEALVHRNILAPAVAIGRAPPKLSILPPSRSALEGRAARDAADSSAFLEVLGIVCSVQLQLKTRRLSRLLVTMATYRDRRAVGSPTEHGSHLDRAIVRSIHAFRQSRPYVPIDTCCLLDSVSLIIFLARRGLPASLVFGVTNRPFAAHCWAQSGDWVLNDTVGNALAHTPIRTI